MAVNFDSGATQDDGSCTRHVVGCMDAAAANFLSVASVQEAGSCEFAGCTDSAAENFDSAARFGDGSCLYVVQGQRSEVDDFGCFRVAI